ncbi:hypothetical protein HDU82_008786 [Entophlyctis luteolus]|nr:hypothetical protein HDU82_008786 [Entophlyctis luteolus]
MHVQVSCIQITWLVVNPSDRIAKLVHAHIADPLSKLHSAFVGGCAAHTVEVSSAGLDNFYKGVWRDAIASGRLACAVHIGVNAAATRVCFELVALNCVATYEGKVADADDAPELLPSTFSLGTGKMHAWVVANAEKACWSRDAGRYFCNEMYYRSLLSVQRISMADAIHVIFVHVPLANVLQEDVCASVITSFLENAFL